MNNVYLDEVKMIRFLGIIINNRLTWEEHKKFLRRKVAKSIGIIKNCKKIMTENELIGMYKTFIQSNFLYGIEVWGHSVKSETDIISRIQDKIIRILFDTKRTLDAWNHSKGRILTIKDLYEKTITKICFKHHQKKLPLHFRIHNMPPIPFKPNDQASYNLRSDLNKEFCYEVPTATEFHTDFYNNCVKLWNNLPIETRSLPYKTYKY